MKRNSSLVILTTLLSAVLLTTAAHAQDALAEFDWNVTGGGTHSWTTPSNWIAPAPPIPGNADYPDDPDHENVDEEAIGPVVGANLSVGLTGNLNVQIPSDITIASLNIGVDGLMTEISSTGGMLLFEHDEPNISTEIPDPDPDEDEEDPNPTVDEFTLSYNGGRAVVFSNGNAGTTNTISAVVGSTETIEFAGTKSIVLSGGIAEVAVDSVDHTTANNTNIRSHIGSWDPSLPIESQARVIVSGPTTTVVDELNNPDVPPTPEDIPLHLNAGGSYIPEYLSSENTETAMGHPHGILDLVGGVTGDGRLRIGSQSLDEEAVPLATVVLYDNTHTGRNTIERGNVILRHDNAFGTGHVVNGHAANEVGYNLIVEPNASESDDVERVIANEITLAHDFTVKGNHSLKLTGVTDATNSGSWINLLAAGETLTLTNTLYTSDFQQATQTNRYGFDGSGETRVQGEIADFVGEVSNPGVIPATIIEKLGSGVVFIEPTSGSNTFTAPTDDASIRISGGNLHFATVAAMGSGEIDSRGGAIGVDSGTVAALSSISHRFTNFANRDIDFGLTNDAAPGSYDHGALMLTTAADASASLDFTSGNLTSLQDMTVAAPEGGMTFTGSITPSNTGRQIGNIGSGTPTYRLGGGSGTLTLPSGALTGSRALLVTNGGDYDNPDGEDRVRLGMVKLEGTNSYSSNTTVKGKYQSTLQDVAEADTVGSADTRQYHGTTLAVDNLGALGSQTSAASLMLQGSTLRYEGAGESSSRLFTIGGHGATLDVAENSGPLNFTSSSALVIETVEVRSGKVHEFFSPHENQLVELTTTEDLSIGMEVMYTDPNTGEDITTEITDVLSETRVQIADPIDSQGGFNTSAVPITFVDAERTFTLSAGANSGDNIFSPVIGDPSGGVLNLEKTGAGKWIVNGANSYTGDTTVAEGTFGVMDGVGTLAAGTDLSLVADALLEIEIDGVASNDLLTVTGTATLAGAIDISLLSGFSPTGGTFDILTAASIVDDGLTLVGDGSFTYSIIDGTTLQLSAAVAGLPGDYNEDNVVDAADYTMWRDNVGQPEGTLPNDGGLTGDIGQDHYTLWSSNYGATLAAVASATGAVPEPSALVLLAALAAPFGGRRRF